MLTKTTSTPGIPAIGAGAHSGPRVLVVDDEAALARLYARMLRQNGYEVLCVPNGREAVALAGQWSPDVVIMDVVMPSMDGFEACRLFKADPATRLTPVVLATSLNDRVSRLAGIEAGADDFLRKPVDACELLARLRSLVRVKRYTDELESAESMIRTLTLALEARDRYTEGHSSRLAEYAIAVGRALDLDAPDLRSLGWGGYLHDIGKIAVPDAILRKEGPLTAAEYEVIKTHPAVGDHLCSEMHSLASVRPIVRHHHEKLDGSGYPDGLRGDRVPLLAQIVSVADAFDAITTDRPYRRARSADAAFAELWKDVDLGLRRADVVSTFVTVAGRLRGSSQGAA